MQQQHAHGPPLLCSPSPALGALGPVDGRQPSPTMVGNPRGAERMVLAETSFPSTAGLETRSAASLEEGVRPARAEAPPCSALALPLVGSDSENDVADEYLEVASVEDL